MAEKAGSKTAPKYSAAGMAFLGVGTFMQAYGKYNALSEKADAERANAQWYREEAAHAEAAGARQHLVYERESQILHGEQAAAFAKAGIDSANSSFFMASQMLARSQGLSAIDKQSDMEEKLARLRAEEADRVAGQMDEAKTWEVLGTIATTAAIIL